MNGERGMFYCKLSKESHKKLFSRLGSDFLSPPSPTLPGLAYLAFPSASEDQTDPTLV